MAALNSYFTGTISIGAGATSVVGVGSIWTGGNVFAGDTLVVAGHEVTVLEVVDATHLTIEAWPYSAVTAGSSYKIYKNSPLRVTNAQIATQTASIFSALASDGYFYYVDSTETVPDPSLGDDGQYAFKPTTGEVWLKTGGIWVASSFNIITSGVMNFSNTTEATGVGTTFGARFAGGVEIAKKLFIAGAVALATTLNVVGVSNLRGNVGIGANVAPDSLLTVNANTALPVTLVNPGTHFVGADATAHFLTIDTFGGNAGMQGRRANGTLAAKTAVTAGTVLLQNSGAGWNGAAYTGGAVTFVIVAAETFTNTSGVATANGAYARINTTPIGSTTSTEAVRFQPSGGVSIGATAIATDPGIGSLNITNNLSVLGTTASTTTTTGALIVGGGVGVAGALNVGGNIIGSEIFAGAASFAYGIRGLYIIASGTNTSYMFWGNATNNERARLQVTNSRQLYFSLDNGETGHLLVAATNANIPMTTASSSTTTGALTVGGGVGVGGSIYAGGAIVGVGIYSAGAMKCSHPTGGLGYDTGAGGTVTQATSKSTGVSLSKVSGQITMNAAALAAATIVSFVLTNTAIAATDTLVINHVSGGTPGAYGFNAQCAAGSATINVRNNTAGSLSEAIVLQFNLIKGVTS